MTADRMKNGRPVLAVEGLTLWIAGEKRIDDLSFHVNAGERVCLLGASGCGKSLTAKSITGVPLRGQKSAAASASTTWKSAENTRWHALWQAA